ncbi:hypothetical protein SAMN05421823_10362 [Catalinimonas alkaloidigena]|uniref:Uncharacterized protein n=2 Tax=Catalinimonas alkaloidigena TaxID=1075417 RepID=A0A1G9DBA9_9BACT|nr:hypothetical protein SAMN05421823_10362 [Catalinimonas alkaloidigena]
MLLAWMILMAHSLFPHVHTTHKTRIVTQTVSAEAGLGSLLGGVFWLDEGPQHLENYQPSDFQSEVAATAADQPTPPRADFALPNLPGQRLLPPAHAPPAQPSYAAYVPTAYFFLFCSATPLRAPPVA